jgi:tetratricopeptide (TPR) repeat protein
LQLAQLAPPSVDDAQDSGAAAAEMVRRAREFAAHGDWVNARQEHEKLVQVRPGPAEYLLLGAVCLNARDFERAIPAFKKALLGARRAKRAGRRAPERIEVEAHFGLALAYLRSDKVTEALKEVRTTIRLNSGRTGAYFLLGEIQMQRDQSQLAIEAYEKAIDLDPEDRDAYLRLAKVYTDLGEAESEESRRHLLLKAIEIYERFVRIFPKFSPAHNNLGVLHLRLGNFDAARAEFEHAVAISGLDMQVLANLGFTCIRAKRLSDARSAFERGINHLGSKSHRSNADNLLLARHYLGLGVALADLFNDKDIDEKDPELLQNAETALLKAIELDPASAAAHSVLGAVYAELGRMEKAQAEFIRAIWLDPQDQVARVGLPLVRARLYEPKPAGDIDEERRIGEALQFLDSLLDGDEEQQREEFAYLKEALEEDRSSYRKLFAD